MQTSTREQLLEFFGLDKPVVQAQGGELRFADDQVAFDFLSQYGANPLGANDEYLLAGLVEFADSGAPALCQPLSAAHAVRAKARLKALFDRYAPVEAGGSRLCAEEVFFTQSGAESVELAIKIARSATLKPYTIALENGFHGKTTGAVQLTANEQYRGYFRTDNGFVRHLSTDPERDLEADFNALTQGDDVNAIVLEFVQGEGGMRVLDVEWVQALVRLARARNILVIADEVQTGLGRTGAVFACEHYGVRPDLLLLAKALGGGLVPIGACIVAEDICPTDFSVYHSSTFANNNFTCFVANRFLDRLEQGLVGRAGELGDYLGERLQALVHAYPNVFSHTSGLGLMRGVHLHPQTDSDSYVANFSWNSGVTSYAAASWLLREQQMLTMPCFSEPSCLRVQPPLNSDRAHIDRGIAALGALGELLSGERGLLELLGAPPQAGTAPRERSVRTAPRRPRIKATRKFQFTVHPLDEHSSVMSLPSAADRLEPAERGQLESRLSRLIGIGHAFSAEGYAIEPFRLGDTTVEGRLFVLNKTARQIMDMTLRDAQIALETIGYSAADFGADVLGLGAFTSILAGGGHLLHDVPAAVTAGSSLTAYAAVHGALTTPEGRGQRSYGVVGAGGSVGALCWQMLLAEACSGGPIQSLTLFYNPENPTALANLANVARRAATEWLEDGRRGRLQHPALMEIAMCFARHERAEADGGQPGDAFIKAVGEVLGQGFLHLAPTDDAAQMGSLEQVLVSTNQTNGVQALRATSPDASLYDIGFPPSIDSLTGGGSRTTYQAGLVSTPEPWQFGRSNTAGLPPGVALGCFSETMTLAATDPQAAPRGKTITLAEAERIGQLSRTIGLTPLALDPEAGSAQLRQEPRHSVDRVAVA